jgi:hypothetical protein
MVVNIGDDIYQWSEAIKRSHHEYVGKQLSMGKGTLNGMIQYLQNLLGVLWIWKPHSEDDAYGVRERGVQRTIDI